MQDYIGVFQFQFCIKISIVIFYYKEQEVNTSEHKQNISENSIKKTTYVKEQFFYCCSSSKNRLLPEEHKCWKLGHGLSF